MRKAKTKTIPGNLSRNKELNQLIEQFPGSNIDTSISINDKNHYTFLGFNSIQKGLSSELSVKKFTKDANLWDSMTQSQKDPDRIGGFHSIVMIHNPHIEEVEEEEEEQPEGRLTKSKMTKINKLMEQGKGKDDKGLKFIAKELNLSFKQVKNYIQSF